MFGAYHDVFNWQKPPNRQRLGNELLNTAYRLCYEWLSDKTRQANYFSLTTDAWTSAAMDKFVALNVSFVDFDYILNTLSLAVIPLNESHTWQIVTEAIAKRIYNIMPSNSVLVATTTDNGSNFLKVARALHTNIDIAAVEGGVDSWDEPVDEDDEVAASFRCVAHRTQLAVNDVLNGNEMIGNRPNRIPQLIEMVRSLHRHIRASPAVSAGTLLFCNLSANN